MPNNWYTNAPRVIDESKSYYEVIEAKLIDSYYYHGSFFEHTWRMKLKDSDGNIHEKELDTPGGYWEENKNYVGKIIEVVDGSFTVLTEHKRHLTIN